MRYLSVCSGIEAASVAWGPLGWTPVAFSEIEPFPCAVLAHHYPDTPNWGDMTKFQEWPDADVDVLVGGTPCQSFSVAGLRRGLDDPRGNLALTYLAIAERYRPQWVVWENVPGVLSSNGGRDFGSFLGGLGKLGYGFAYRVLDAQYVRVDGFGRAVPQRRRRVFVVGCAGDWRRAAAVLFDAESLSGNPAPRREAGKAVAPTLDVRAGRSGETSFHTSGGLIPQPAKTVAFPAELSGTQCASSQNLSPALSVKHTMAVAFAENSRHELRLEGGDGQRVGAISTGGGKPGQGVPMVMTLAIRGREGTPCLEARQDGTANAILTPNGGRAGIGVGAVAIPKSQAAMAVRRLTPVECSRLQGFPDDYLDVLYRGKPAADGPRYKALGNSMAVNAMRWLGVRIQMTEDVMAAIRAAA